MAICKVNTDYISKLFLFLFSCYIKVSYYLITFVTCNFLSYTISLILRKFQTSSYKTISGTRTIIFRLGLFHKMDYQLIYRINLFICNITFKTVSEIMISLEILECLCEYQPVNKLEFLNILINHSSFLQTRKVISYLKIRL